MSLLTGRTVAQLSASNQRRFFCSVGQSSRHRRLSAAAGRAAGQEKTKAKNETGPRQCPCGSGLQYRDCCGPIVAGAWARTAPELARARFTASVLGKAQMLADTTHPEALDAIGTKQSLLKKMEQLTRSRSSGEQPPALADCVHGQSQGDPDAWFVLLGVSFGAPGLETVYPVAELYRKDSGRWWYMDTPREFPILEQFVSFLERYGNQDDCSAGPIPGRYEYTWVTLPPRALADAAAQERPQWLADDWPASEQQGWVYLDTAVDPETGLTAAQAAAQTQEFLNAALRDPKMDWDSYYFRFGRFME